MCGSHDRPSVYENRKCAMHIFYMLCAMCLLTMTMTILMVCWSRTHDIRSFFITYTRSHNIKEKKSRERERKKSYTHWPLLFSLSLFASCVYVCDSCFFRRFQHTYILIVVVVVVVLSSLFDICIVHTRLNVYVSKIEIALSVLMYVHVHIVHGVDYFVFLLSLHLFIHAFSSWSTQISKLV